ncbi:hypothetical protein ACGF3K_25830 [Streptomyces sp. NPDC047980]|uniref:hypothetical protein n=1 Tax=Streptomyces sp. NPDC047980 TaxID=3365494 RepID=UPI00371887F6
MGGEPLLHVHMGQRAGLLALAVEVGAGDSADAAAGKRAAERCPAVTGQREHAEHEDTFIHPLLRERDPVAADALDAEHLRLGAAIAALDDRARAFPAAPPTPAPRRSTRSTWR